MKKKDASFIGRALLAIFMMLCFYLLAAVLLAAIAAGIYLVFRYGIKRDGIILSICCLMLLSMWAYIILYAMLPRHMHFHKSGVILSSLKQEAFTSLIHEVADSLGMKMPDAICLNQDLNASVHETGGLFGLGRKRIMIIGLPLLLVLSVSELKAIIAHEYGHYYGKETRLGPIIYRTQASAKIIMTAFSRSKRSPIYLLYYFGKLYLAIVNKISRVQELDADLLAARLTSRECLVSALKKLYSYETLFEQYWKNDLQPLLEKGCRPPLCEGFLRYLSNEHIKLVLETNIEKAMKQYKADQYDTHPTLRRRIELIMGQEKKIDAFDKRPAYQLLEQLDDVEKLFICYMTGDDKVQLIEQTEWDIIGHRILLPAWNRTIEENRQFISELDLKDIRTVLANPVRLKEIYKKHYADIECGDEALSDKIYHILGCLIAVKFIEKDWKIKVIPGSQPVLCQNGREIYPFEICRMVRSGRIFGERMDEVNQILCG